MKCFQGQGRAGSVFIHLFIIHSITDIFLVRLGCCNKIPKARQLEQQRCVAHSSEAGVQHQCMVRPASWF